MTIICITLVNNNNINIIDNNNSNNNDNVKDNNNNDCNTNNNKKQNRVNGAKFLAASYFPRCLLCPARWHLPKPGTPI